MADPPNRRQRREAEFGPPRNMDFEEPVDNPRPKWRKPIGAVVVIALAMVGLVEGEMKYAVVELLSALIGLLVLFGFSDWFLKAMSSGEKIGRFIALTFVSVVVFGVIAWACWPHIGRHTLKEGEQKSFEVGLNGARSNPPQPIQFSCPNGDQADCVYAERLIPLFRSAGWKTSSEVKEISLAIPLEGITLVQHSGTGKAPDFWDPQSGAFVPITPDLKLLRKAFNNIGIEPNSGWSYEVPMGQIRIHVGVQRDDESAPTELTTMMASEGDIGMPR
jgi:hypothetical protein